LSIRSLFRQHTGSPEREDKSSCDRVGEWKSPMDDEVEVMNHAALVAEVKRLRTAIREHRDSSGHEPCWHYPKLWSLLPEGVDSLPVVPPWPQFLRECIQYRESLDRQLPQAQRTEQELCGRQSLDYSRYCNSPHRITPGADMYGSTVRSPCRRSLYLDERPWLRKATGWFCCPALSSSAVDIPAPFETGASYLQILAMRQKFVTRSSQPQMSTGE
jgi:hypothetical protein